jgi:hypothetical protein
MTGVPKIEFLWWQDCPSWDRALEMLREAMREEGLDPASIAVTEIDTELDAKRADFPGSPTIRIDGADFQPPGADAPRGLTCRVYRLRDGRASPLPDPQDLREALRKARDG